jgi:AcrR family transcriptional regulator
MPLPRFHRLPAERRAEILRVARRSFAEDGPATASYNKIITAAGISKTAAYQYFDGREDLLTAVLDDLADRLLDRLGPWSPAADPAAFWRELRAGAQRLRRHLAEHPDDLALADAAVARAAERTDRSPGAAPAGGVDAWLAAVVDNGRQLGIVRPDLDPELVLAATAGVLRAGDAWLLAAVRAGRPADLEEQVWSLLAGVWAAPTPPGTRP